MKRKYIILRKIGSEDGNYSGSSLMKGLVLAELNFWEAPTAEGSTRTGYF
jgi:hypothetical protein